jgi:hypothetical protein
MKSVSTESSWPPIVEVVDHTRGNGKTNISPALSVTRDGVISRTNSANFSLTIGPNSTVNPNPLTVSETRNMIDDEVGIAIPGFRPLATQIASATTQKKQNK